MGTWGTGNNKQTMYFVLVTETRHKPISYDNGKILVTLKIMSKLCFCDYLITHCSMVHEHIEKRLTLTFQGEKIMDFDYYEKHLTSISNKMLWQCWEKQNLIQFTFDLQTDKKISVKEDQEVKFIQILIFSKLSSSHEVLRRLNVVHIKELFLHQGT